MFNWKRVIDQTAVSSSSNQVWLIQRRYASSVYASATSSFSLGDAILMHGGSINRRHCGCRADKVIPEFILREICRRSVNAATHADGKAGACIRRKSNRNKDFSRRRRLLGANWTLIIDDFVDWRPAGGERSDGDVWPARGVMVKRD